MDYTDLLNQIIALLTANGEKLDAIKAAIDTTNTKLDTVIANTAKLDTIITNTSNTNTGLGTINTKLDTINSNVTAQTTSINSAISTQTTNINSSISSQTKTLNDQLIAQTATIKEELDDIQDKINTTQTAAALFAKLTRVTDTQWTLTVYNHLGEKVDTYLDNLSISKTYTLKEALEISKQLNIPVV